MLPPLRQSLAAAASSSAGLRRCVSTASARPPWAIIEDVRFTNSPAPRAFLEVAEPPSLSNLLVPVHLINPKPRIGSDPASLGILDASIRSASGDGHLLLQFADGPATAADAAKYRAAPKGEPFRLEIDPDVTRCVCNPLSGEMFRLPDIDGTKKVRKWHAQGLLTQSDRGDGPPDRFAVAELSVQGEGNERSFVMRRFFSKTGKWDKLVGLPSPLPRPRRMDIHNDVLAFAGRLWWLDLTWGAVCADPFSDRPELRFVELPWGSVRPVPGPGPWTKYPPAQGTYRRMGVSEGKLRYVEVSEKEPFILSSFTLDDDYSGWMLEHQVALSRVWADAGKQEGTPRIGVIDPLNAHAMCVIIGDFALTVDMDMGKVLARVHLGRRPGKKEGVRNKTLADILVRSGRD